MLPRGVARHIAFVEVFTLRLKWQIPAAHGVFVALLRCSLPSQCLMQVIATMLFLLFFFVSHTLAFTGQLLGICAGECSSKGSFILSSGPLSNTTHCTNSPGPLIICLLLHSGLIHCSLYLTPSSKIMLLRTCCSNSKTTF